MTNPKISIIIPCYNSEKWISQCVESALSQDYDNYEVIAVDNESKDNSLQILQELQSKHRDLVVSTAPNLYKYSWEEPVAEAMKYCTGEYFTILGSDDFLDSKYLSNISKILVKAPQIKVMQSPLVGYDSENRISTGTLSHSYKSLKEFKSLLFEKSPVITPTLVYKKELYDNGSIQWNSEKWVGSGDYNCYFNFTDLGIFIYPYPEWLGYFYRWHPDQSTWGMHKNYSHIDINLRDYWKKKWGM